MSGDRELLELAAKAAGESFTHKLEDNVQGKRKGPFVVRRQRWTQWNPLIDDGDALRLAVKLNIFSTRANGYEWPAIEIFESHGSDPYAATRRAIVRASAEMGRRM